MSGIDWQELLGFELVVATEPNGAEVHLIRETGADDREASLEERVLWSHIVRLTHSVRDGFAASALQGLLADMPKTCYGLDWQKNVTRTAYELADLMLKERAK